MIYRKSLTFNSGNGVFEVYMLKHTMLAYQRVDVWQEVQGAKSSKSEGLKGARNHSLFIAPSVAFLILYYILYATT